jgi:hypothetical protein
MERRSFLQTVTAAVLALVGVRQAPVWSSGIFPYANGVYSPYPKGAQAIRVDF